MCLKWLAEEKKETLSEKRRVFFVLPDLGVENEMKVRHTPCRNRRGLEYGRKWELR